MPWGPPMTNGWGVRGRGALLVTLACVPPSRIIATPGRLMHVAVEMNLKLQSVEYVVFDEADR